ncbi:hypothetical protein [Coleofasciculus sp. FACHB-1120]|uniref:hypothetical protein n=1 Tax=Coleofasciculus sp. FACHB-1120 TaxID=2692783 RepID=UPI0016894072|nr:hypothetical protein [Coleofasciculus sp. FACHB-1120]MBD2740621.1 hypothetical protein [Coleofasciculus sp. FACHB-1120]
MTRLFIKLIGFILLLAGVYFLGKNIIFASHYFPYYWRNLPAMGSVLAIMGGVICLMFFRRETGTFGAFLLGLGIVLVFMSGGVILRQTSLWNFFVGFAALAGGYKLLNEGRINF